MSLPTRPLGSSGFQITMVGFGSWAIGGGGWSFGWGPQDDTESIATMRHALELGVNWIDTAAVYGLGHSEEVVGKLLRELPASERPLVFTKCGLTWDVNNPMQVAMRDLKPETIRRECEASLRRLGVERIDLYQFHWPDETGTPVEDSWSVMVKLIEEGKVRAAGVSNFDVHLLERCEKIRHVDSLQPLFSMISRAAGKELLPWCKRHNSGVICTARCSPEFSPMASPSSASRKWRQTTGAGAPPSFGNPPSAAISRCAMRCGPSPRATEYRSPRLQLPGHSAGPA